MKCWVLRVLRAECRKGVGKGECESGVCGRGVLAIAVCWVHSALSAGCMIAGCLEQGWWVLVAEWWALCAECRIAVC